MKEHESDDDQGCKYGAALGEDCVEVVERGTTQKRFRSIWRYMLAFHGFSLILREYSLSAKEFVGQV